MVLYHARVPGAGAGYLGVDVFFVISGFLITGQLLREADSTGTIRMASFYARRVRRLLPAFIAMAVGTSLIALRYLLPMDELRLFGGALSRSAAFYYNIAVWRGSYDYGAVDAQQQVLMHTWSLAVEEQFYVLWPWLCLVVTRLGRPFLAFSMVTIASLIGSWWVLPRDASAVFFLLPFRVWELGLGACAAALPWSPPIRVERTGTLVGLALMGWGLLSPDAPGASVWPGVVVSVGTALVVALGRRSNPASVFLAATPMVRLGQISYAWYLWHWPLLVIARLVAVVDSPRIDAAALASSLVLAALTHLLIERPARRIEIRNPSRMLAWGMAALAATAVAGQAIELRGSWLMTQPENASRLQRLRGTPLPPCPNAFATLGCDISGEGWGGPSLLLWGDSFAKALSPAVSEYARASRSGARLAFESSCPPLLEVVPGTSRTPLRPNSECQAGLRLFQQVLPRERSRISGIVLAARWIGYVPPVLPLGSLRMFDWQGTELDGSDALSRGLAATLDLVESIGSRALIVGVPPDFPFDVPRCLWRIPDRCFVSRSWHEKARDLSERSIEKAIRGRPYVRFVRIFDLLCPGPRCGAGTLDEPLLADRSHLSAFGAETLVLPALSPHLDWLRGRAAEAPRRDDRE